MVKSEGPIALSGSRLKMGKLENINEQSHEIMALFVLRKLILQTRMHSHPVELDVWVLSDLRPLPFFMCANSEGSGETAWLRSLAWAFAGCLCDKYHNLMSWLKWAVTREKVAYSNRAKSCKLYYSNCAKSANRVMCCVTFKMYLLVHSGIKQKQLMPVVKFRENWKSEVNSLYTILL